VANSKEARSSALVQLTLTRFREFLREPEAVFWTFVFPLLLATGLGIAFRNRPAEVSKVAVLSASPNASGVAATLTADEGIEAEVLDDSAATTALRIGAIAMLVVPGDSGRVEYRYDAARPESRTARLIVDRVLQQGAGRTDPMRVEERLISERGSRYIDFVIPGLLGMNLMGGSIWGIGFSTVDARRKKLLKRYVATPMSRAQYLMSFMLMRLVLMVIEVAVLLGFGMLVFKVPMRGSVLELALISLLATAAFGAIGLLVASRARTIEGASGLMNAVMLPMWVASGIFFAASNFPSVAQPFIQALPLTAVVDALRANMLRGGGWHLVGGEVAIISAWLVVCFFLALRLFRWK